MGVLGIGGNGPCQVQVVPIVVVRCHFSRALRCSKHQSAPSTIILLLDVLQS